MSELSSPVSINISTDCEKLLNECREKDEIKILCFDLTYYNKTTQFLLCCLGVFALYLLYGFMQELIFTLDGFKPYGWYLTLIQFGFYILFALCERKLDKKHNLIQNKRTQMDKSSISMNIYNIPMNRSCLPLIRYFIAMKTYCLLALLTLGTMGLSNSSLGYLNYPTQVIFKCCKLIPVLCGSILIQNKKHGPLDFLAAFLMCIGLIFFTLADSKVSPNFNSFGILLISMALLCDAIIGNVQEKTMRENNTTNNEIVLYSYGLGFVLLFIIMAVTGNLISGLRFCAKYPVETYGYAFLFSLSGYLGIQFVLTLVRTCGAPLAATVTTARKAVSIAISFIFFSKPFTYQYVWSGLIVVLGIYVNVYSKKNNLTFKDINIKFRKSSVKVNNRFLFEV